MCNNKFIYVKKLECSSFEYNTIKEKITVYCMFTNQRWIKNEYKSLKNPTIISPFNNYQGILNETFNFKNQKKKFDALKISLEPFDIYPQEIYYSELFGKPLFIVTWSNLNLFWRKNESMTTGTCQNHIYYKDKEIKISEWLKLSREELNEILQK